LATTRDFSTSESACCLKRQLVELTVDRERVSDDTRRDAMKK
jgi:hypothetical protein